MERRSLSRPGFGRARRRDLAERVLQWRSKPVYNCVAAAERCWRLDTIEVPTAAKMGAQHCSGPGQRARARSALGPGFARRVHAATGTQPYRVCQRDLQAEIKSDRFRRVSLLVDLRLRWA